MSRELKSSLTIEAQTRGLDKITAARQELQGLGADASASNPALEKLRVTLGELAQQQRLIHQFGQLKLATAATATEMQRAQAAVAAAARELKAKQTATQAASAAEQAAGAATARARAHHDDLRGAVAMAVEELKQLRAAARESGGASAELAERVKETEGQLAVLRAESQRAGDQVKALGAGQRALGQDTKAAAVEQTNAEKAMARAVQTARNAKAQYEAKRQTLHSLRQELARAGISSVDLADAQRRVTASVGAAGGRLAELTRDLAETNPALANLGTEAQRAAGILGRLGVRSQATIRADIQAIERDLETLARTSSTTQADFDRAWAAGQARIAALKKEMDGFPPRAKTMREGVESISASLARVQKYFLVWQGLMAGLARGRELIETADRYKNIEARIALMNRAQEGFNVSARDMADLALRTHGSLENTAQLTSSLARAGEDLELSQQAVLRLTETINKANQVSVQSAASADAAVVQLIQSLQSGVLRGDEFNSIMEQAPRLARALADGLGVPISALRALAQQGKLTSSVVIQALQSQAAAVDAEFAALPRTIGRALTDLGTAWTMFIGELDRSSGVTATLAAGIQLLAGNLDVLGAVLLKVAQLVALHFGIKAAMALREYMAAQAGATASTGALAAAHTVLATTARAAWAAMAASPAFIIVGLVELARALVYVISNWSELTEKVRVYLEERRRQKEIEAGLEENQRRLVARLAEISKATGVNVTSMKALNTAVAEGKIHFDEASGAWRAGAGSLAEVERAAGLAAKQLREVEKALTAAAEQFGPVAEAAREALADVSRRLDDARARATSAAEGIAGGYDALSKSVLAGMEDQIEAIRRRHEAERGELEASAAAQRDKIAGGTRLLIEQLAAETTARQHATEESLRLLDQAGEARRRAAEAQADTEAGRVEAVRRVENEILAARKSSLEAALDSHRRHVDALNAEARRHLDEVTRIEQAKALLRMSTEDRVREILRGAMEESQALEDRRLQAAEKSAAARDALARGEYDRAKDLAGQAMELSAQVASAHARDAKNSTTAKSAVNSAIQDMLAAEKLVQDALSAEARSHEEAARRALTARGQIDKVLVDTERQVRDLGNRLSEGMRISIDADTSRLQAALDEVAGLAAEKAILVRVEADLSAAEKQLAEYEALLRAGRELPVDADFSAAEAALERFAEYARDQGSVVLEIQTETAMEAVGEVQGAIEKLNEIRTESRHLVEHNAAAVRAALDDLDGRHTSSTHTVYVRRVEVNADGGLAGRGAPALRFATGGVAAPRMVAGTVPGAGDQDSVARTLPAGAYVVRKAAVAHYGRAGLLELIAWAKSLIGQAGTAAASWAGRAGAGVNALLMPGEQVFSPGDVASLGVRFFDALNAMTIPPPARFEAGGWAGHGWTGYASVDELAEDAWRRLIRQGASVRPEDRADFEKWFHHLFDPAVPDTRVGDKRTRAGWLDILEFYADQVAAQALAQVRAESPTSAEAARPGARKTGISRAPTNPPPEGAARRAATAGSSGMGGGVDTAADRADAVPGPGFPGRPAAPVTEWVRIVVDLPRRGYEFAVPSRRDAETVEALFRDLEAAAGVAQ